MRKHKRIITLCACITFYVGVLNPAETQTPQIASPTTWYVSREGIKDQALPSYAVEFEVPLNASNLSVYTTMTGIERRVLALSTVSLEGERNGKQVIRVTSGYRARQCSSSISAGSCAYKGTIDQWASVLRLRFKS